MTGQTAAQATSAGAGAGGPRGTGPARSVARSRAWSAVASAVASAVVAAVRSGARSTGRRWLRLPSWAQALAVFAVSRVLVTFAVHRHARLAGPGPDGEPRGYLDIAGNWDGAWYLQIIREGYPGTLPRGPDGLVDPNQWAFYPLYPLTVRLVTQATGASWVLAATVVSLACGAVAVVVLRSLVEQVAGRRLALWTVVLFCVFPASAVLQLPYSESLAILLIVGVLACLQRHVYVAAVPLVLLAGLSRPVAVPLALVIGLHALRRLRGWRRGGEALAPRELLALAAVVVAAGVAAGEWPLIAWVATGEPDAYTQTMAAWRSTPGIVPFLPWWEFARGVLGAPAGAVALVGLVVGFGLWVTSPRAAVIAGDLRAWCLCYGAYLLAVLESFTSLPRYLLPLFPLATLLAAASPSRAYRVAVALAFTVGGLVWLAAIWRSPALAP